MMGVFLLSVMILNSLFRLTINSKFICVCKKIIVFACVFITLKLYHKVKNVKKYPQAKKNHFLLHFLYIFLFYSIICFMFA